jgi:predicted oxidoreductase
MLLVVAWLALICGAAAVAPVTQVRLTPNGPLVSRIAYGGLHWAGLSNSSQLTTLLQTCLSLGITTLDLADIYGYRTAANLLGQSFRENPGLRNKFQIVYKFDIVFPDSPQHIDTSKDYILQAVNLALQTLNTSWIDILMPHAPDLLLDPNEVATAFAQLKNSGKVRYFGVSNFSPSQFDLLDTVLSQKIPSPLVVEELECSVLTPTPFVDGRVDHLYARGRGILAWGPLGGDPLGGANRLFNFQGDRQVRILSALDSVGTELGLPSGSQDQVAVAWLLRHPSLTIPILGTTKPARLVSQATNALNLASQMTRKQWTEIMGASAVQNYFRWEQLHSGQWHDVVNDRNNGFGTPVGVDVPTGFCDFGSCQMPSTE